MCALDIEALHSGNLTFKSLCLRKRAECLKHAAQIADQALFLGTNFHFGPIPLPRSTRSTAMSSSRKS